MPPRFAYWTILIDNAPTAFRARDAQELLPTLNQLKRKNENVIMKWFSGGVLWDSPEAASEARRRPRVEEHRSAEWRPGGQHKDPRARFDKKKRPRDRSPKVAQAFRPAGKPHGVAQAFRPAGPPRDTRDRHPKVAQAFRPAGPTEKRPYAGPPKRDFRGGKPGPHGPRKPWGRRPASGDNRFAKPWRRRPDDKKRRDDE